MDRPGTASLALACELVTLGAELARDGAAEDAARMSARRAELRALGERMRAAFASDDPAAARLRERLGLPEAAAWLYWCCAAVELDPTAAEALGVLQGSPDLTLPAPHAMASLLALACDLPRDEALRHLCVGGPAERLGLVTRAGPRAHEPLNRQPFRLSERELQHLLAGVVPVLEPSPLAVLREPPRAGFGLPEGLVRNAAALLLARGVLCVRVPSARVGRQLAVDLATLTRREAWVVAAGDEPPDAHEVARLRGGLVTVDLHGLCLARPFPDAWLRAVYAEGTPLVVLVPRSAQTAAWPAVALEDFDHPTRRRIWRNELADPDAADALAARFKVSADEVRAAAADADAHARLLGVAPDPHLLTAALLAQGARRMGRHVTALTPRATLDDLVVPDRLRETLREVIASHRVSATVFDAWGLGARTPLGRGLACLFSGPPGTGKTFAAQCIAGELGLNLYRIDLSQVVSKYIGETEKSLAQVFEEAEAGHGLLLFDEADALFGKRAEVKDAHDRYANVEVAYLLQRMESFDGISVLTTNLRNNLDAAFLRRLRYVLEFPLPDAGMREALWERSLPSRARWAPGVSIAPFVDRFTLAGGHIQTIGLAASHLAAAEPEGVLRVEHLVRATWRELEKLGMGRSREDFGPLARHLPDTTR